MHDKSQKKESTQQQAEKTPENAPVQ